MREISKQKVMVVEDEISLLKLECILLNSRGYQVCSMGNGKDALECMEKEMPNLVLLDVSMPGVDGFEVCRLIKSNPVTRHILVVLLTAKKRKQDREMGEQVMADCYITKPFKSIDLMGTIDRLLN